MIFKKTAALLAAVLLILSSGAATVFALENEPGSPGAREVTASEPSPGSAPDPGSKPDAPSSTAPPPASSQPAPPPSSAPPAPEPEPEPDPEPTPDPTPSSSRTAASSRAASRPANANPVSSAASASEADVSSEVSSDLIPGNVSSETVSLPDVGSLVLSVPNAMGSGTNAISDQGNRWYGVIAWVCIGAGVIIVLVILVIGNRRGPKRRNHVGRKRYQRKSYKSGKKHLLDDRYYSNKYRRR